MREMSIDVVGERLVLHLDRAIWWPRTRTLLLADVHFGKGSVLRQSGISVPAGQTATDLERLDSLVDRYQPTALMVLGDLVHGRSIIDAPWVDQVRTWRQRHKATAMRLVAGNHDRHFDPEYLGFEVVSDVREVAPFVLRHEPVPSDHGYVLAGHVHPGVSVRDGWRRHRFPAFRFGTHVAVLPAFGGLTGLHEAAAEAAERIFAVTPGGLIDVSRMARPQRAR